MSYPSSYKKEFSALYDACVAAEIPVDGTPDRFQIVPANETDIALTVTLLNQMKAQGSFTGHLHTISTGKSWGIDMGEGVSRVLSTPVVTLNLLRINHLGWASQEQGIIQITPGVTQQQLHEFLWEQGAEFYLPRTGAGPDTSPLANALDRGFGIFGGATSLRRNLCSVDIIPGSGAAPEKLILLPPYLQDAQKHRYLNRLASQDSTLLLSGRDTTGAYYRGAYGVVTKGEMMVERRPDIYAELTWDYPSSTRQHIILPQKEMVGFRRLESFVHSRFIDGGDGYFRDQFIEAVSVISSGRVFAANPVDRDGKTLRKNLSAQEMRNVYYAENYRPAKGMITLKATFDEAGAFKTTLKEINCLITLTGGENLHIALYEKTPCKAGVLRRIFASQTHPFIPAGIKWERKDSAGLGQPHENDLATAYLFNREKMSADHLNPGRDRCGIRFAKFAGPRENSHIAAQIMQNHFQKNGYIPAITMIKSSYDFVYCLAPMLYPKSAAEDERSRQVWLDIYFEMIDQAGYYPQSVPYDIERTLGDIDPQSAVCIERLPQSVDPRQVFLPPVPQFVRRE